MKIDLNEIPLGEPTALTGDYDPALLELNTADIEFLDGLHFEGLATRGKDFLQVTGQISSKWKESCGRCLARSERKFDRDICLTVELSAGDTACDFTPEMREEILISYPAKFLCDEACKGLCSNCGANLNVAPCGCYREEEKENPFSVLKKLKKEKE